MCTTRLLVVVRHVHTKLCRGSTASNVLLTGLCANANTLSDTCVFATKGSFLFKHYGISLFVLSASRRMAKIEDLGLGTKAEPIASLLFDNVVLGNIKSDAKRYTDPCLLWIVFTLSQGARKLAYSERTVRLFRGTCLGYIYVYSSTTEPAPSS